MKKVVIKGRWNNPIEYEWQGDLITTLRALNHRTIEEDNPGYFFEVSEANKEFLRESKMPIFMDKYYTLIAPHDYTIVDNENVNDSYIKTMF